MDIEFNTGSCNNCKGINSCNKYCILHAGKALVDFINRVDMIETRIGEYESSKRGGKLDLVTDGHLIFDVDSPNWLLTDINTTLDASSKFNSLFDKTAFQLANIYCTKIGMNKDEVTEVTNKITKINKNKLLVLPFKPHTQCNIYVDAEGNKHAKRDAKIRFIRWVTDKQTYKLICEIGFEVPSAPGKTDCRILVTDYIDKFRLSSMDIQAKNNKQDDSLIKVTNYGMIKPIVVRDKNVDIAIDGTYMYCTINGDTRIIGYWDANDKINITIDTKSKAINKIMDNINFIKNHKKYIAPYLIHEANVITL